MSYKISLVSAIDAEAFQIQGGEEKIPPLSEDEWYVLHRLMERALEEHASDPETAARNFLGRLAHDPLFQFQGYFEHVDQLTAAAKAGRREFETAMHSIATTTKGVTLV